ncbi:MAG: sulfide/dihydroorotate dehydrogenase-like FAD/NAD-binding protein [Negativicutes bacterium]|jgi:ferredoxin--NADP+ reductase
MFKILEKHRVTPVANYIKFAAPEIAKKAQPGQIIQVKINEQLKPFPLSLADYDADAGWIVVVCQEVGEKTRLLGSLSAGEVVADIKGPLLPPLDLTNIGTQVLIGGGSGIAAIYDMARGLRATGNNVIVISGARSAELVFFDKEIASVANEYIVVTSDGSKGESGRVTDVLERMITNGKVINKCVVVGPEPMMQAIKDICTPHGIKCQIYGQSVVVKK